MTKPLTAGDFTAFITQHTLPQHPAIVPELKLYLASSITPLWHASEELFATNNVPPPYWSFAWPGGQAVARFILDHPEWVRGKRVFDFASGSGILGFAALRAGAKEVVANDVDPVAATAIGLNGHLNGLPLAVNSANMIGKPMQDFDLIIAGDVCYEWPTAGYVLEWLRGCVASGTPVLLADPGRTYAPKTGITELARYTVPVSTEVEEGTHKTAVIYRLEAEE